MSILSIRLERGQAIGKAQGEASILTDLIIKKIEQGIMPKQISEILEIDLATVEKIYNIAKEYGPNYNVAKISEIYRKSISI